MFSGDAGTPEAPYLLSTAVHYRMTADIDLGCQKKWIPNGYYYLNTDDYRFEGVFDGGGYTACGMAD